MKRHQHLAILALFALIFASHKVALTQSIEGSSKQIYRQSHDDKIISIEWHPTGEMVAVSWQTNGIDIYDNNFVLVEHIETSVDGMVRWSPSGEKLAWVTTITNKKHGIQVFDTTNWTSLNTIERDSLALPLIIAWSPDSEALLVSGADLAEIRSATTGELLATLDEENSPALFILAEWNPVQNIIATNAADDGMQVRTALWDASTGQLIDLFPSLGYAFTWSPDGTQLASTQPDGIYVLDVNTRALTKLVDTEMATGFGIKWQANTLVWTQIDAQTHTRTTYVVHVPSRTIIDELRIDGPLALSVDGSQIIYPDADTNFVIIDLAQAITTRAVNMVLASWVDASANLSILSN